MKWFFFALCSLFFLENLICQEDFSIVSSDQSHRKSFEDIIKSADSILITNPHNQSVLLMKGNALFDLMKLEEAKLVFKSLYSIDSTVVYTLQTLSSIEYSLGNPKLSIAYLERLLFIDPANTKAQIQLAKLYHIYGYYNKSIPLYRSLLNEDSTNFYFYKQIGIGYENMAINDNALLYLNRAFNLNMGDAGLASRLANLYVVEKQIIESLRVMNIAISVDSLHPSLLKQRGYLYYLNHEFAKSIADFNKSYTIGDSSPFLYKYYGLALFQNKDYENSISFLLKAFKLDEKDTETSFKLGVAYSRDYDMNQSNAMLKKTFENLQPDSSIIYAIFRELGNNATQRNLFEDALGYYFKMMKYGQLKAEHYYTIASIYDSKYNNFAEAEKYYIAFMKAAEFDPSSFREMAYPSNQLEEFANIAIRRLNKFKEEKFFHAN